MRRSACAGCGGELTDFLDLGTTPLADKFPQDASVPETWYPLAVAVCTACWLMQLREVVPDEELYGEDYGFRTGSSPAAVTYFKQLAQDLLKRYGPSPVLEVACNDGTLLRNLKAAGCRVVGVEPSGAARDAAPDTPVYQEPFTASLARDIRKYRGGQKIVIACNVAAHVADPLDFLDGVRILLDTKSVAVIEFQDAVSLIAGCQFDNVYHEHRFYYTLRSFRALAAKTGLEVFERQATPAQGGSWRVFLRRSQGDCPVSRGWLETPEPYEGMQKRAEFSRQCLRSRLYRERTEGRVIAGYGASAKSCTLLNWCRLGGMISWVEDLTPGKIGRVTPGSHIWIRSPDSGKPDTYLLTSWNYAGSAIRREGEFLENGGRLIIPGAVPVII